MNMILIRKEFRPDGIFGELKSDGGTFDAVTLEHAYEQPDGNFRPKIPPGQYVCFRGMHALFKVPHAFETFEIMGVPGHSGLLFHPGNYNNDTEGCVLLGSRVLKLGFGQQMVTSSKATFEEFMHSHVGEQSFQLTVIG